MTHPLHQSIFDAANADDGVSSLLGSPLRLYSDPPADPVFPYATYGSIDGDLDRTTIHVWTRHGGRTQALEIVGAMIKSLPPFLEARFADVFRSGDGRTTHGLFRVCRAEASDGSATPIAAEVSDGEKQ